jgi:hypothetical protein
MRIDARDLGFTAPPGFTDATGYSFEAEGPEKELCDVGGGPLQGEIRDLDGLFADRRATADIPGASVIEGEGTTTLAGLPARTLTFLILDDEARYREHWAMALDTPDSYVQIAYSARADNPLATPRFLHAVASASFSPASLPTPAGYVRRWAGKLWLDVPAHLLPPRVYQFVSADETRRLEVGFFPAEREPSIESELARDLASGGAVTERSRAEITTPELTGARHAFTITRTEEGVLVQEVVVRAHLRLRDVPVAHVFGRAPSIDAAQLAAEVDALVQSLTEAERR